MPKNVYEMMGVSFAESSTGSVVKARQVIIFSRESLRRSIRKAPSEVRSGQERLGSFEIRLLLGLCFMSIGGNSIM